MMLAFSKTQDSGPRTQDHPRALGMPAFWRSPLLHSSLRPLDLGAALPDSIRQAQLGRGRKKTTRRAGGFTLIEMLIVISIISVLLGLLYGALERAQKFSRRTITYTELKSIEMAFKQYHAHYQSWPSNAVSATPLTSGEDNGFVIDQNVSRLLQGVRDQTTDQAIQFNPESIPFIEFARFSPVTHHPVNPFKQNVLNPNDTIRSYKVLFDTDGDRQIWIEPDSDAPGTTTRTNIIASVAVWTVIPATRTSNKSSGQTETSGDVIFGSWDSFGVK